MSKNVNAKEELLNLINYNKLKIVAAVVTFGDYYNEEDEQIFKLKPLYTKSEYDEFLKFMDREYYSGYGAQELFAFIYCEDGVWVERGEYDGSEWYEVHKYPDLRKNFSEADVIKYERYKKLKNFDH